MDTAVIEARGPDSAAVAVVQAPRPAVSWGAVIGGAFVIAATAIILLGIGAGFGLSSVSPWPGAGVSATTFTAMTAIWLIVAQWLSSAIGGYIAGRLSRPEPRLHADESYFHDTAHGIFAWAVAAVVTIALLGSAVTSLVGGTAKTATTVGASAVQGGTQGATQNASAGAWSPDQYLIDTLYRTDKPDANASGRDVRAESTHIIATDVLSGNVPQSDRTYLANLVAARTGISQDDAKKRVDDVIAKAQEAQTKARQAADDVRKAAMHTAFFIAFSMLVGAFIAGVAGRIGGNRRDVMAAL